MNAKSTLLGAAAIFVIAASSVASAGDLVAGGALAPPTLPPIPTLPIQNFADAPNHVAVTAHAYTGNNLFGSYEGIQKLGLALDVLTVQELDNIRVMQQHGDLLGSQRILLHGISRGLGNISLSGTQPPSLGTFAVLAGYYIALAGDCGLPTAPIEASLDKILQGGSVAPSEVGRYKSTMIQSRVALAGAGTVLGCLEAKRQLTPPFREKGNHNDSPVRL
jgi:hypothetical protein